MAKGKFDRRAEWIWRPRGLNAVAFDLASPRLADEANRYVYFRRSFEISDAIRTAPVYASADGRYQLYANGRFVGRGPGRCSSSVQSLDDYDLAPYLKPGRNVIAALVHSYGRNTAWYELPGWDHGRAFGCGGLFLQGDATTADGISVHLDTDGTWRCLEAEAWQRDVPSNSLGFMEIYDARRAPKGWMDVDFDDARWWAPEILRVPGRNFAGDVVPFAVMMPRTIPAMHEELSSPAQVVGMHEVANGSGADLASRISGEALHPLEHCRVSSDTGEIVTTEGRAVSLIYDFGEVVAGYICLDVDGPAGASIDLVHGEQLHPDGRVRIFGGIAGFDAVPAHRYILREGAQSWERFEWNGLRFLQLTVRDCALPLRIRSVAVRTTGYPVKEIGAFACSDDRLNRIWQAGALTLRRCMHDGYVDCPSREQRQWMDAYLDARINYAAFGDARLAAQLLRQMAQSQRADGLTMMAAPGDFSLAGFTNIPDFCLYWIMMIADYVLYSGDEALAGELFAPVVKAIGWFEAQLNAEHLLTDVPHWVFVDWADLDKQGQVTALNAQFVAAARAAAGIAKLARCPRQTARFEMLAAQTAAAINAHLWDEARGVYADARARGRLSARVSQQANAAVIAYDVAPRERWDRIFRVILDEARLVLTRWTSQEPSSTPFDEAHDVALAQPFFMHVLHRAMRKAGLFEQIVKNIRKRWLPLLDDGDTTFRETWQLTDVTSKCHAWSATPTFDLSCDVLGVLPLAAGFRKLRIAPQPTDLTWARGAYPTPLGTVSVAWTHDSGHFALQVDLPEGCEAEVVCPLPGGWTQGDAICKVSAGAHGFRSRAA